MRACTSAFAVVVLGWGTASAGDLQGSIHNKSVHGFSFSVVDNGTKVCEVAPDNSCNWAMSSGYHRVELLRSDGATIWGDFEVKDKASAPNTPIEDCDFESACPVKEVTAIAP